MAKTKKVAGVEAGATVAPVRLVLIDSHAILHRAYHALPDFTSSRGEPTGALYGLCLMILSMAKELRPDFVVAAFDLPKPTYRHEAYQNYKAGRSKTDAALSAQIQRARDVFKALNIPILEAEGFEADDVLGTVVEKLRSRPEVQVFIVSGDMDTLQLVEDGRVSVYTLRKGVKDTVTYDEAAVVARYGFGPALVPDYKGLAGDQSDNIVGVPGIGEKTAKQLIATFGGVEDIYAALRELGVEAFRAKAKVTARIANLLVEHEEEARFSRMLATIRRDAPVEASLAPETRWGSHDFTAARQLLHELEFRSLVPRLAEIGDAAAADVAAEAEAEPPPAAPADPTVLAEASVGLWVLDSSHANPSAADVAHFAGTGDLAAARENIFATLRDRGLWDVFEKIERPIIPIVARMNAAGVAVDAPYLRALAVEYREKIGELEAAIHGLAGEPFNLNSPRQLGEVLFVKLAIGGKKLKKTPGGVPSTREDVLETLLDEHPIVGKILEYRELEKLRSTYLEKLPDFVGEDGRLRTTFLQAGAATGRMSSQDPNLQNIPAKGEHGPRIRRAFVAPAGKRLLALDYSQIELRVAAILSGDPKLSAAFREGRDIHAEVAAEVFGVPAAEVTKEMRRQAKVINFGVLYGMGVSALQKNLGLPRAEAQAFYGRYFEAFPSLSGYMERTKREAAQAGYAETLFGRRRYLEGLSSPLPFVRAGAERMAINAPVQGTAADMLKVAMARADRAIEARGWRGRVELTMQIHDELVYEVDEALVPEAAAAIREAMSSVLTLESLESVGAPEEGRELVREASVPIEVEASTGENWAEMRRL